MSINRIERKEERKVFYIFMNSDNFPHLLFKQHFATKFF